ncbi:MAG TPA: hypothetical protein PLW21_08380 [Methanothrix sp.]|nr:hypothetical protein [Methanothrix sp.]
MINKRYKPSKWFYGFGIIIIIVGTIYSISILMSEFSKTAEESKQMVVPGSSDLMLSEKGTYTIFYENQSVVEGKIYITGEYILGLEIEVFNKTRDSRVATFSPSASSTYTIGGRTGRSILAFNIDEPGIYELSASYSNGSKKPEIVLAIVKIENMMSNAIISGIIYVVSFILGLLVIYFTYIKRKNNTENQDEADE